MEYLNYFSGLVDFVVLLKDTIFQFSKQDWNVLGASAVIILGIYAALRPTCKTRASRSWIITGINSAVMTGVGVYYLGLYIFLSSTQSLDTVNQWLLSDEVTSKYITLFFVMYLFCDLMVGIADYLEQVTFWAGWFHHNFYLILSLWIIHKHSTAALNVLGSLELPTLVIATGQIDAAWNSAKLVGISFVSTRIVLLFYFLIRYSYLPGIHAVPPMLFIFCLHCAWLYSSLASSSSKSSSSTSTNKPKLSKHD